MLSVKKRCKDKSMPRNIQIFRGLFSYLLLICLLFGYNQVVILLSALHKHAAFIFMDLQYIGQTTFKSLNKKKQAIFFSLLRKVFIVVPLTYLLPYALGMGTRGVFMAEPVSNVIGGSLCFLTMLATAGSGSNYG